ncbi:hypothetical protein STXM2123_4444 [Streptomyces sp. F-3]|nr:hypothetical protein STXM2123_4444 [Streptomyces sp. F-3]
MRPASRPDSPLGTANGERVGFPRVQGVVLSMRPGSRFKSA